MHLPIPNIREYTYIKIQQSKGKTAQCHHSRDNEHVGVGQSTRDFVHSMLQQLRPVPFACVGIAAGGVVVGSRHPPHSLVIVRRQ